MNTDVHIEYILSLINNDNELVITDDFRYKISITVIENDTEAKKKFIKMVKAKLKKNLQ